MTEEQLGLNILGLNDVKPIHRNLPVERLIEEGLLNGEVVMGMNGATIVDTGAYTGRSPKDKFFVEESSSVNNLWWGSVNRPVDEAIFDELYNKIIDYYNNSSSKTYIFDGFAGADLENRLPLRVIAKRAWQAHFCHNMFICPTTGELDCFTPEFTIINASDVKDELFEAHGLNSETFVIFNLKKKIAIIGGTEYGGEMKKG
ncbi:MAG: phosphoenolpyruvate carboxykinase (ATP), partial [Candidatus Marinimicrobia bacterium]|nr:phosphoenolpyruvate carboxykinase (ATP) [Candidatus Neomarinimicrobiota bacterium]